MDLGSSSYEALVDAIMNAKPAPKPVDTGVIYNPQEMERQRFEEHTGYDPTVSDLQNLIAAWKGNKILDAPIPGANPEVGTPGDAMVGALTGAMSKSGSASNPLADLLGQTAGGGMAQQTVPGGRIRPDAQFRGPLEKRIKGKVYRETNAGEAEQMLMGRNAGDDRHYATSKNLALGQGSNRGIKLESDPRQLEGKIDRSKPGSQIIENRGQGEVLANANIAKNLQDSIRRVTVDKSIRRDKLERAQTRNLIKKLAREGWHRTEQGSNIILKRPVPSERTLPPKPPSPPEQRRPLRAGPEERRIRQQIVEIDRRIAESDRRLKDRGLSGREPTSARYETPVDKQVREIREAIPKSRTGTMKSKLQSEISQGQAGSSQGPEYHETLVQSASQGKNWRSDGKISVGETPSGGMVVKIGNNDAIAIISPNGVITDISAAKPGSMAAGRLIKHLKGMPNVELPAAEHISPLAQTVAQHALGDK